jgi:hypothetical protein
LGTLTVVAATDIVGAVSEALDSLRWRFAGMGVVSMMVVLSERSSRSRLCVLGLWDWRLPDIILFSS